MQQTRPSDIVPQRFQLQHQLAHAGSLGNCQRLEEINVAGERVGTDFDHRLRQGLHQIVKSVPELVKIIAPNIVEMDISPRIDVDSVDRAGLAQIIELSRIDQIEATL